MKARYLKAIEMLKTKHVCPSAVAQECDIDEDFLHDMTDACHYDDIPVNCRFCREDALAFMMQQIKE